MKKLSWTPVRTGHVFCAPGCGGGCLKTDYDKAKRDAEKLARKLGPGWKPRVWENLGWHWEVVNGGLKISFDVLLTRPRRFVVFLGEPDSAGGWWVGRGAAPLEAISEVLKIAQREFRSQFEAVEYAKFVFQQMRKGSR